MNSRVFDWNFFWPDKKHWKEKEKEKEKRFLENWFSVIRLFYVLIFSLFFFWEEGGGRSSLAGERDSSPALQSSLHVPFDNC